VHEVDNAVYKEVTPDSNNENSPAEVPADNDGGGSGTGMVVGAVVAAVVVGSAVGFVVYQQTNKKEVVAHSGKGGGDDTMVTNPMQQ
jgi:hypothetical protein